MAKYAKVYYIVGMIVYIFVNIYYVMNGYIFNSNNIYISLVIVSLFLYASLRLFYLINYNLKREDVVISDIDKRKIYSREDIRSILSEYKEREELKNTWVVKLIQHIVNADNSYGTIDQMSISRIIDNKVIVSESLIKYIIGTIMLIGLLGSFIGIIKSVQGIESTLENIEYDSLIGGMGVVFNGVHIAFGTSILGIISSLILGYFYVIFKEYENTIYDRFEKICTIKILPNYFSSESQADPIVRALDRGIKTVLRTTVKEVSDNLNKATLNLIDSSSNIKSELSSLNKILFDMSNSQKKLSSNLKSFGHNTQKIEESMQKNDSTLNLLNKSVDVNTSEIMDFSSSNKNILSEVKSKLFGLPDIVNNLKIFEENVEIILNNNQRDSTVILQELGAWREELSSFISSSKETIDKSNLTHAHLYSLISTLENFIKEKDKEVKNNEQVFNKILKNLEVYNKTTNEIYYNISRFRYSKIYNIINTLLMGALILMLFYLLLNKIM